MGVDNIIQLYYNAIMTTLTDIINDFGRTVAEIETDPDYEDSERNEIYLEELDFVMSLINDKIKRLVGADE